MPEKKQPKNARKAFMEKGFSFVEVMVAVFLIAVGVIAAVNLLSSGLRESLDSRTQLTAALLAQEGVELVRNIRDNNWAASRPTFENISTASNCIIGLSNPALVCGANVDRNLRLSSATELYDTTVGSATKFQRRIAINNAGDNATVTGMVIWGSSFQTVVNCNTTTKCAYAEITLTDWGEQ